MNRIGLWNDYRSTWDDHTMTVIVLKWLSNDYTSTYDEYERTSSIKIGDCCIQYTFNKIRRSGLIETTEVLPLFEHIDPYKNQLENIISQTKISHNQPDKLKVLKLNRKEKNVVQLHSK